MYRKASLSILTWISLLMIVSCTSNGMLITRNGSIEHEDSMKEGVSKFRLKNGQKGNIAIDGNNYAFELLRINSQTNVTIVLQNGKKYHLLKKTAKSVQFNDSMEPVVFELEGVVQDAATIHVRKPFPVNKKSTGKTLDIAQGVTSEVFFQKQSEIKKIRLNMAIVDDTTVKLSLDGQNTREIPLPQGTEVGWQAETSVEIDMPEVHKTRLEINGTCYKSSRDVTRLHLFVKIEDGKLTIEYR